MFKKVRGPFSRQIKSPHILFETQPTDLNRQGEMEAAAARREGGSRSTRRKRPKRTEQSREPARSRSCTCTAACEDVRHSVRTAEVGRRRENLKRQVEFRGRAWGVLTQVKVSSALRRLARGGIVWTAGLDSRPGEWGAEIRRYRTTAKYAGGSSSSAPEVLRLWKPTASSLLAPADNLKIEIAKIQEYGKG